jgi:hypothetical protein
VDDDGDDNTESYFLLVNRRSLDSECFTTTVTYPLSNIMCMFWYPFPVALGIVSHKNFKYIAYLNNIQVYSLNEHLCENNIKQNQKTHGDFNFHAVFASVLFCFTPSAWLPLGVGSQATYSVYLSFSVLSTDTAPNIY